MVLLPKQSGAVIGRQLGVISSAYQTSNTYKVDFSTGHVAGFVDGIPAMRQAIYKILQSERFYYLMYSWQYGIEMNAVMGKSFPVFVSEVKRVLREALLADRRITELTDLEVTRQDKRTALVSFTAKTIFGDIPLERTVSTHV